ncbi:MAG: WHG domain-containing protein [Methylococcaceae bacterium]|jgi:AcrR family transcriptional regulator
MARRSEHSQQQIREMVLNAAQAIVIEEGFVGLTVRKIAMSIDYTVGSIYMVFENMADLVMHINAKTLDDIELALKQDQSGSPEERIQNMAKAYLKYANQNYNRWQMIFEYRLPQGSKLPDWYLEKIDYVFSPIERLIAQLTPHDLAQTKRAARALWSGVHGICVLSLNGSLDRVGVENVEASVDILVNSFLRGWVKQAELIT